MPTISRIFLLAVLASAGVLAQTPPRMEEPRERPGQVFRVDAHTGSLITLEDIVSVMKGGRYGYSFYLPGQSSAVAFPYGEKLMFAMRVLGKSLDEERAKPTVVLEYLAVKDEGRFATKKFVPMDVSTYGEPMMGLDHIASWNRPARTFLYSPREPLPPGEYALSMGGLLTPWAGFGASPTRASAFRVTRERAAAPRVPAGLAPAAPTAPTAGSRDPMSPNFDYLGFFAELEQFVREDKSAATTLRSLAEAGDPVGKLRWCVVATNEKFNLGVQTGDGLTHCRELAERQSPVGMFVYGRAFITEGRPKDTAEAVAWLTKAADKNYAPALYLLARLRFRGEGVATDVPEGIRLLRKAVETGTHPTAAYTLATLYINGSGVEKNVAEGARLMRVAAVGGDVGAMYWIGSMLEAGNGVPRDDAEALAWYRKAAERGNGPAIERLKALGK